MTQPQLPAAQEARRPRWVGALAVSGVAALAFGLCSWRLSEGRYMVDEGAYANEGAFSLELFLKGDFDDPFWSGLRHTYGYPSPPVGKLVIGAALKARGETVRKPRAPSTGVLVAGRIPGVILATVGAVSFLGIARRILGDGAGLGAALLLVTSPVWLLTARRAMFDLHAVAFSLVALHLFILARERARRRGRAAVALLCFLACGAALGLAVGSRFSAGGVAVALGLLVATQAIAALHRPERRREGAILLGGGAAMTLLAIAIFVGSYPYLYDDTLPRLFGLVGFWQEVWESRIDEGGHWAGAYRPGLASFRELARLVVVPGGAAAWLLAPAVVAGVAAVWRRPSGPERDTLRLLIWALAAPGLVVAAFQPSRLLLSWIVWVGLVGGLLCAGVASGGRGDGLRPRDAAIAFAVASSGAIAVTLRQTYIAWPRYYLHVVPAACLLAAWGLAELRSALTATGSRRAARAVLVACLLGGLAVAASGPLYLAFMGAMAGEIRAGSPGIPGALTFAAALTLAAAPLLWGADRLRARQNG